MANKKLKCEGFSTQQRKLAELFVHVHFYELRTQRV